MPQIFIVVLRLGEMAGEFQRSLGLELGGSRNDRTAIAVLDFSPRTHKLILNEIDSDHSGHQDISSDELLIKNLKRFADEAQKLSGIGVHAPTSLPPLFDPANPNRREHLWMQRQWAKLRPRPKPFVPYLQRPSEVWMRYFTPEKFLMPDGMGSNVAPLAARFRYLATSMPQPIHEVYPRATLSRIVSSLGMPKNFLKAYTDLEKGVAARESFFNSLLKKLPQIFIYEYDLELMILNLNCFHAFLAALTQHIVSRGEFEPRPKGYPKDSAWIHIPKADLDWTQVFAE